MKKIREKRPKTLQLRWPARISRLVEATVGGCAFCSMVLRRFFGPGNAISFTYQPEVPWMCKANGEWRRDVVAHAMHLLTLMKNDEFVFTVEQVRTKASVKFDFNRLRIELSQAKQGKEVLSQVLANRGQQYFELDVYAAENNPAAAFISSRPPNASPALLRGLQQIKAWLDKCEWEHGQACASTISRLPRRVIDVSDLSALRLVEPANDSKARYVALSYCWGKVQELSDDDRNNSRKAWWFRTLCSTSNTPRRCHCYKRTWH